MAIPSDSVGRSGASRTHEIDARWTMAYAAALGDTAPAYLDTAARPDVLAHPMFPVCFEWPLMIDPACLPLGDVPAEERVRGVHATHDLALHRPIRAGATVTTRATVVQVETRRPGAYACTRLDTTGEDGEPVCTTWYGTLYRGVPVAGGDRSEPELLPPGLPEPPAGGDWAGEIPVAANAAHVYTECARIWNPIHTDAAVAARGGLPEIILHGTATLALGVSRALAEVGASPDRVRRIQGRFAAMVPMPNALRATGSLAKDGHVAFALANAAGATALRDGRLVLADG